MFLGVNWNGICTVCSFISDRCFIKALRVSTAFCIACVSIVVHWHWGSWGKKQEPQKISLNTVFSSTFETSPVPCMQIWWTVSFCWFSSAHLFLSYTFLSAAVPFLPFSCNFICFFSDRFLFDGPKQLNWDLKSSINFPEGWRVPNKSFTLKKLLFYFQKHPL